MQADKAPGADAGEIALFRPAPPATFAPGGDLAGGKEITNTEQHPPQSLERGLRSPVPLPRLCAVPGLPVPAVFAQLRDFP